MTTFIFFHSCISVYVVMSSNKIPLRSGGESGPQHHRSSTMFNTGNEAINTFSYFICFRTMKNIDRVFLHMDFHPSLVFREILYLKFTREEKNNVLSQSSCLLASTAGREGVLLLCALAPGFLSHHCHQQPLAAIGPHHDDYGCHTGDGCVQYGETLFKMLQMLNVFPSVVHGSVCDLQAAAETLHM